MGKFKVVSEYTPSGGPAPGHRHPGQRHRKRLADQVLLGVTGSGKTYTMAKVIERVQRPTLVLAHNKTWRPSCAEFQEVLPGKRRGILRVLL